VVDRRRDYSALGSLSISGPISWAWSRGYGNRSSARAANRCCTRHSRVSCRFPDAALGALAYAVDAVAGTIGGAGRLADHAVDRRTVRSGVGPLGLVSGTAGDRPGGVAGSLVHPLPAVGLDLGRDDRPAMDEVLASLQLVTRVRERGMPLWEAFWHGDRAPRGKREPCGPT
jgi:hypothetical protein